MAKQSVNDQIGDLLATYDGTGEAPTEGTPPKKTTKEVKVVKAPEPEPDDDEDLEEEDHAEAQDDEEFDDDYEDEEGEEDEDEGDGEAEEDAQSEVSELRRELYELKTMLRKQASKEEEPPPEDDEIEWEDHDFVGEMSEDDLENLLSTKAGINSLLNQAARIGAQKGTGATLRRVPRVVSSQVREETQIAQLVNDFYSENRDLVAAANYVAVEYESVLEENPNLSYKEAIEEAGKRVRKAIGKPKPTRTKGKLGRRGTNQPSPPDGSRRSRKPRNRRSRKPKSIKAQIDDMARA